VIARAYSLIRVEAEGSRATISLHNPLRKNAIGPAMVREILRALRDALDEESVRAIVLTGSGSAFCAGGDFAQMSDDSGDSAFAEEGDYGDLLLALTRSPKPIVARVHGHAMGGGLGLVAASHFAIAARGAMLGTPEVNVGLFPMMIMAVLQRVVPRRRLLEMMLFGERMTADEAAAIGLVNRAVDAADLDAAVTAVVDTITSKSPMAIRLGLSAYAAQADLDLETALPLLRDSLGRCLSTDDAREGMTAFLEKRKPNWTGR
jgi:enoyl-CoA hydratase/carnithine racemase